MSGILFGYNSFDMKIFFKKVFRNMVDFWKGMNREELLEDMHV